MHLESSLFFIANYGKKKKKTKRFQQVQSEVKQFATYLGMHTRFKAPVQSFYCNKGIQFTFSSTGTRSDQYHL